MVFQNTNNARRVFVVTDTTDITAKKVYDAGAAVVPDSRRVYAVTPYDVTCHKVRVVAAGTPGAVPVTAVDASGSVTTLVASLVTSGLVAEYRVDDGTGQQLTDSSGNARHGTLGSTAGADTNDPAWVTGGLSLDGVDDYASTGITAALFSTSARTTQVALTPRTAGAYHAPFANDVFGIQFTVTDWLMSHYGVADVSFGTPAMATAALLTVTYDGTTLRGKVNGGAWVTSVKSCGTAAATVRLGERPGGDLPLDGVLHHAVHYNRVLTDPEVAANYTTIKARLVARGVTLP